MRNQDINMPSPGIILLSLITTYMIFAVLLNSVGTVILQSIQSFAVSKSVASTLEGFKDLPIAIVSFLVASYLPRFGYRKAMILGMCMVGVSCIAMPLVATFAMTQLQFLVVGVSFALIKVSVYSLIGHVSPTTKAHAANMNLLEGCFMLGVLAGYWLFGAFIDQQNPADLSWLSVYWVLAALAFINILLLRKLPAVVVVESDDESHSKAFKRMLSLVALPFVVTFVLAAFFYVLIEQGVGTWLPTFNNKVLNLSADISVQITSIFAACLAIGRLSAGLVLRYINWYTLLIGCILAMCLLLIGVLPLVEAAEHQGVVSRWQDIPLAAFLLPAIGMFMAPIYPAINSVVLSALPRHRHAAMTGLIVIFSALGGTIGSVVTGSIFEFFGGQSAFYFMLVPMVILLVLLTFFRSQVQHQYTERAVTG